MCKVSLRTIIFGAILASLISIPESVVCAYDLTGIIMARDNSPIIAANLKLFSYDSLQTWVVSDTSGKFSIESTGQTPLGDYLEISAIGFTARTIRLSDRDDLRQMKIFLKENPIDFGSIIVESHRSIGAGGEYISAETITDQARRSIIPTNSSGAIKQPQVVRDGSVQSAKIRVNGTSPAYFINGAGMGDDPNHYGMFNIIASPNLSGMDFYAEGTTAKYESPSVIEFRTARPFKQPFKDELNLSFIEGTNSASVGTERFFMLTSIRKSFLDLLIKEAPFKSDRLTIPPTAFVDWFASSGVKLGRDLLLISDQYYSKDYLSYDLSGTKRNPSGLSIKQNTEARFISLRLESTYPKFNFRLETSTKTEIESYNVMPFIMRSDTTMRVALNSSQRISVGRAELNYSRGNTVLTAGNTIQYSADRELDMRQKYWNFTPPDASSDNPYIYQPELDYLYGSIKLNDNELDNASYIALAGKQGNFEYSAGIRESYFQKLHDHWFTNYRLSAGYDLERFGVFDLFYGTFSESPIKRILEPYQALVRAGLNQLNPISTELISFDYSIGKIKLGAFTKNIARMPVLKPDFNQVDVEHLNMGDKFLSMRSDGKLSTYGADITLDLSNFPTSHTDLAISYGYSHSRKTIDGLVIPYELDAPHKINLDMSHRIGKVLSIGGNITARSGYPYTTPVSGYNNFTISRYAEPYYQAILTSQYSARFPFNYQSSVYANLDWGNSHLYLTIINITNRKNPLISSADGYIYDNGILPSLGYSYKF